MKTMKMKKLKNVSLKNIIRTVNNLQLKFLSLVNFVLFRFFDILKPFPIKWVDKNVSGGFGILIDDILAGLMAGVVLIVFVSVLVTYV